MGVNIDDSTVHIMPDRDNNNDPNYSCPDKSANEFNFVAMSDVFRDHGISPVSPKPGEGVHAINQHHPYNNNSNSLGEHSEFSSHRSYLAARKETYDANSETIKSQIDFLEKNPTKNQRLILDHNTSQNYGFTDYDGKDASNKVRMVIRYSGNGNWNEITGFLRR